MKLSLLVMLIIFGGSLFFITEVSGAVQPGTDNTTYNLVKSISPKKYRQLTGKKMSLKERLALKVMKWKSKLLPAEGEATEKQIKQGRLSLIFGAVALGLIFIPYGIFVSIPLAVAGLVLGVKSLKGNSNTQGILGVVFSSLVLFVVLLAIISVSIMAASWY